MWLARQRARRAPPRGTRRACAAARALRPPDRAIRRSPRRRPPPHCGREPAFRREAQDRGDPRVRVLHVVRGILVVLALGEIEVEIEVGAGRAQQEEELGAVGPDLVDQLAQRDEFSRPLAHRHRLRRPTSRFTCCTISTSRKSGSSPERQQRGFHPRHVTVVIRSPEIDHVAEPTGALVTVVGDIGQQVGRHAVARAPPRDPCRRRSATCAGRSASPTSPGSSSRSIAAIVGATLGLLRAVDHAARLERRERVAHRVPMHAAPTRGTSARTRRRSAARSRRCHATIRSSAWSRNHAAASGRPARRAPPLPVARRRASATYAPR